MSERLVALRRVILHNKELKLISLAAAVVAWYAIRAAIRFETVITDVPLTIQVEKGWAITDQSVSSVDVLFRGSQEGLRSLSRDRCLVEVDLRGRPFQTNSIIKLEPKYVRALGGARAVQIQPDEVTLRIDQESDKAVAVQVDTTGDLPPGYEVEKVASSPASVIVHGPQRRLKEIETVHTAPVGLEGRGRSFKLRTALVSPSDQWVARIEPLTVTVDITIVERSAEKALKDVRVSTLVNPELAPRVKIWPTKVDLVISGRPDLIQDLQKDEVNAYVDCARLETATSYDLPVRVHAQPGLTVKSIEPATVKVELGSI